MNTRCCTRITFLKTICCLNSCRLKTSTPQIIECPNVPSVRAARRNRYKKETSQIVKKIDSENPIDSWKNVVFKLPKNYQHLDDHLLGTLVD